MRFLLMGVLLLGCSHHSLKFKYNSSKRYLASLTNEASVVSKIEVELKHPDVFASGIDSTFLFVKLLDNDGNLLTDVDPNDLTLSSNVDIEAKPFVYKQGVYRSQILPRIRSPKIILRVDWLEKVASPEIQLKTRMSPKKDALAPVQHDYWETKSDGEISFSRGSATPQEMSESFSFDNVGGNKIVKMNASKTAQRSFSFDYIEQARQNLSLMVDDISSTRVSQSMHSIFMFFPRKNLFLVEQLSGTVNVTIPTGEKVIFQRDSKEIVDGVLQEGPLGAHFPDLKYTGKGTILRANARGESPELGEGEGKIDLEYGVKGSEDALIINGLTGQKCRRPKTDFWDAIDVTPIEFKFVTDEEFDKYLKENCGFGLFKSEDLPTPVKPSQNK